MAYEATSIYYLAFHRNHLLTPALDQGLLLSISLINLMAFVLHFGGRTWLRPRPGCTCCPLYLEGSSLPSPHLLLTCRHP